MTDLFAYPRFTCGFGGGEVFILYAGYFLCCHVFPMVSELDYSLLKHVVINNGFEFCHRDMSRQGGSWLF